MNTATVPSAGNGTSGNAGYQGTLGGNYTNQYVYTNLGQLWQGPKNGGSTQEQYLYCDSAHPHQLSVLAQASSTPTCSSKGTVDYTGSYDDWGNTTTQVRDGITRTLTYDGLDHLVRWNSSVNGQEEWNLYDASGERVLRRTFDGTNTVITVYAFGEEEHQYSYSGSGSTATDTGDTYYYTLGGQEIGTWDGVSSTTNFLLTDTLGSVVSSFNNLPNGGAIVLDDQVHGPYGNQRMQQGTISTSKGFTGQYSDFLTGLDYYGARYYDPVVGVFLSADVVQGNGSGMNPYAYVAGNPETYNDPTGLSIWGDLGSLVQTAEQVATQVEQNVQQFVDTEPLPVVGAAVVAAPVLVPTLAFVGIGIGIGLITGLVYTALTPQNLASGTLPPIGFDPPRQNNIDTSQPQTQAGGGGQLPPKDHPLQRLHQNPVNRYLVSQEEGFKVTRNYKNIMGIIIANLIHRLLAQNSTKQWGYASCKVIYLKVLSKADSSQDIMGEISYVIIPSRTSLECSQRMMC